MCVQDVERVVRSIDGYVPLVKLVHQATFLLKSMRGVDFLKISCGVEAFGNLTKALCVHSLGIVLPQNSKRTLHLTVHLLLAPFELLCVSLNFVGLLSQFSLKLSYHALELLHFLRPREPLSLSY